MVFLLGLLPVPVVLPIRLGLADVLLLALLRAAGEENKKPVAVPPEVNSIAGALIDLVFENAATDRFDVGRVAIRHALKRRGYLRRGLNVERAQPLRKGASSGSINVFPNVEHDLMITDTLSSTDTAKRGKTFRRWASRLDSCRRWKTCGGRNGRKSCGWRKLHGCRNVRVFGSFATGENRAASDIDFLVDLDEGRNLFDLGGLLADLKDALASNVDLVEARCLHPYIRDRVLAEALPL